MSRGIDYGMGLSNVDKETGIRFGVINVKDLGEWAQDHFEAAYGDPMCPECETEVTESDINAEGQEKDYFCSVCERSFWSDQVFGDSPVGWYLDRDGYKATMDEVGDIFVEKSPWKVRAAFCSPCAPGACWLTSPCDDGDWAYCFGPEWFDEDTPSPYVAEAVKDAQEGGE